MPDASERVMVSGPLLRLIRGLISEGERHQKMGHRPLTPEQINYIICGCGFGREWEELKARVGAENA